MHIALSCISSLAWRVHVMFVDANTDTSKQI